MTQITIYPASKTPYQIENSMSYWGKIETHRFLTDPDCLIAVIEDPNENTDEFLENLWENYGNCSHNFLGGRYRTSTGTFTQKISSPIKLFHLNAETNEISGKDLGTTIVNGGFLMDKILKDIMIPILNDCPYIKSVSDTTEYIIK